MPDGQLILPPEVIKQLGIKTRTTKRIIIFNEKSPSKTQTDLSQFCGRWKDDRDADEIISEIYADRAQNRRSEKFNL
jgi:hypothetical protein